MQEITLLSNVSDAQADQAFTVFVESFYDMMRKTINKDKQTLHALFKESFDRSQVYVCLQDSRPVGFLAYAIAGKQSVVANKNVFRKHLGLWGLGVAWGIGYFQPKAKDENHAIIEYLAVCPSARGQGVGGKLIARLCETGGYRTYTLETTEENTSAVKLYTRLGFVKLPKKLSVLVRGFACARGLGTPIYMKLDLDLR